MRWSLFQQVKGPLRQPCRAKRFPDSPRKTIGTVLGIGMVLLFATGSHAHGSQDSHPETEAIIQSVQAFAHAVNTRDQRMAGQHDFVCLFKMKQENKIVAGQFPPPSDPIYEWCSQRREHVYPEAIDQQARGLMDLWPGQGELVDFSDFDRFYIAETASRQLPPSLFVLPQLANRHSGKPYTLNVQNVTSLPHASFQLGENSSVVAVPTTAVTVRIQYSNPIASPVANAKGSMDWVVPYRKARQAVKAVKVKWIVLSDLKRLGFPVDHAVLDIPLKGPYDTIIPFVIDAGGYVPESTEWWSPEDDPGIVQEAIQTARAATDRKQSIMLLNRVLLANPKNQEAIEVLAHQLYQGLLAYGGRLDRIHVGQPALADRLNELYWTIKSQGDRMDISLDMEMGGQSEPTPADYLYQVIPLLESLASSQPGDFHNRLRLSRAYRWTNNARASLDTPQELLAEVPEDETNLRAQILLALAWSRIGKVAWTRHFDDPDITHGYEEAKRAFTMTDDPLDKFTAAYAMAYSLAFTRHYDKKAMLKFLREARHWFDRTPGATQEAWVSLLEKDALKGLVQTDPSFQALWADS